MTSSLYIRILVVGLFVAVNLIFLSLLLSTPAGNGVQAKSATAPEATLTRSMSDSPNAVTRAMAAMGDKIGQVAKFANVPTNEKHQYAESVVSNIGKFVLASSRFVIVGVETVATGVFKALSFTARHVISAGAFVLRIPDKILGAVADKSVINSIIKPANHTQMPVIEPYVPAAFAVSTPVPDAVTTNQPSLSSDSEASWPIRGKITAPFGASHRPYQRTHTGIDISDGRPSGSTPIKPFKPGVVIEVVRSKSGLGKHVVIDHGGGITSVYGHLSSISVRPGQRVDKSTTLGFVGSTGASTGTHLHFEIRKNGRPVNPMLYINGRP